MPFFRLKNNPFPNDGLFSVEFGIQYLTIFPAGDGLALSFILQPNITPGWDNNPISLWQDNGRDCFRFVRYGNNAVTLDSNDLNYHVVKISYDGAKYYGYIDGILRYTSPSTPRVGELRFGHPFYSNLPGWTGFRLDYIKVTNP